MMIVSHLSKKGQFKVRVIEGRACMFLHFHVQNDESLRKKEQPVKSWESCFVEFFNCETY